MHVLREHQHEISDLFGENGVVFGTEDTGWMTTERPTITAGDLRTNDTDRVQEDGRQMGTDYRGAKTLNFTLAVLSPLGVADPHAVNLDLLNALESVWNDEQWRDDPNAYAMLRSCEAGRTWRCYGRPRRYDEVAGALTQQGMTPVTATFDLVDDAWYSDTLSEVTADLIGGSEGGLVAPIVAPITTVSKTEATRRAVVGGARSTWPVVEFRGPVSQPQVLIGNLLIGYDGTIGYGDSVVYDPRPWKRTMTRTSTGASVAGKMSARTPAMRKARLRPGIHEVTYTGVDLTGTSRCIVSWRNARTRP